MPGDTIKDKRGKNRQLKTTKARLNKRQQLAILSDFKNPAVTAGHSRLIKNIYNRYVYFWRWALWKVFEHEPNQVAGIVSFISASSYFDGDAFCGMREHMRRIFDEIWIIDLGGEGPGAQKSDNVFSIRTPVAIAITLRYKKTDRNKPAEVFYTKIEGSHEEKLTTLNRISDFSQFNWQNCPNEWQAQFRPDCKSEYSDLPQLSDLIPWSARGIQFSRNWPVSADPDILKIRWALLLSNKEGKQKELLNETRDVKTDKSYQSFISSRKLPKIESLSKNDQPDAIKKILFRSFDEQWCIADRRVIDMPRPPLWKSRSSNQIFLITLSGQKFSKGPAVIASIHVPDINAFNNRGGIIHPLYRRDELSQTNIVPNLLNSLEKEFRHNVTPEAFFAYIYGILAHPAFTTHFAKELESSKLYVLITKDYELFEEIRIIGARLIWLHTFGKRFVPKGKYSGDIPVGSAKNIRAISGEPDNYPEDFDYNESTQTLHVGNGEFAPVAPEVYGFEVSGFMVVQSWLKYRMKNGAGKKSSPLDNIRPKYWTSQFTTKLLELLWLLEMTVDTYPKQKELLEAVIRGECFQAGELPEAQATMRNPPKPDMQGPGLFDYYDNA